MFLKDATWGKIKELKNSGNTIYFATRLWGYSLFIFVGDIQWEHSMFKDFWPAACYMTEAENASNLSEFETLFKSTSVEI